MWPSPGEKSPCWLLGSPYPTPSPKDWNGSHTMRTPAPRFFIESARWYSSSGRLDLTLKALQRVAWINGKREEGASLSMEVRPPGDTPAGLHP